MDEEHFAGATEDLEAMKAALAAERDEMESGQREFLRAMVEAAFIVAVSDGELSQEELDTITAGFVKLTEGEESDEDIRYILDTCGSGLEEEGQDARFEAIAGIVDDDDLREGVFVVASAAAWKDGGIGESQGLALRGLGNAFGFEDNKYFALLAKGRAEG